MFVGHKGKRELWRVAAACLALFQIGSTSVLAHADALLDAERTGSPLHVESPENSDCALHHGHLFCQVVRSLFQAVTSPEIVVQADPAPLIRVVEAEREAYQAKCAAILLGSVIPRGPPVS